MEIDQLKGNILNLTSNNYGLLENENALKYQINTIERAKLHEAERFKYVPKIYLRAIQTDGGCGNK